MQGNFVGNKQKMQGNFVVNAQKMQGIYYKDLIKKSPMSGLIGLIIKNGVLSFLQ